MATVTEEGLYEMHRRQRELEQRARYAKLDPRRMLGRMVEVAVSRQLAGMGYQVQRRGHNERFDLLIAGCCRVEVKASTWHRAAHGNRYQCRVHNLADVLIFCCVNGSLHYFVIPWPALGQARNLAVWTYQPAAYTGQWAPYLESWGRMVDAVSAARQARTYQLGLWELQGQAECSATAQIARM